MTVKWRGTLPNAPSDLLYQGVELMLVGMGTVFLFLTILVLATHAMSALALRIMGTAEEAVNPEEIAAITAAIALHRRRR